MISDLDIICNNLLQRSEIEFRVYSYLRIGDRVRVYIGGSEIELEFTSEDRS